MIDLQHHGEPHLARGGMRRGTLVREAGRIVVFEARSTDQLWAERLQELTDTALTPARIKRVMTPACLDALGMAVVGEERPWGGAAGGRRSQRRRAV